MAAKTALSDVQLRTNVRHATDVIQAKRARVVGEMPDWQQLRNSELLQTYLPQFFSNRAIPGFGTNWGSRYSLSDQQSVLTEIFGFAELYSFSNPMMAGYQSSVLS